VWNSRSQKVVEAKILCDLKKILDIALRTKEIKVYDVCGVGGGGGAAG